MDSLYAAISVVSGSEDELPQMVPPHPEEGRGSAVTPPGPAVVTGPAVGAGPSVAAPPPPPELLPVHISTPFNLIEVKVGSVDPE